MRIIFSLDPPCKTLDSTLTFLMVQTAAHMPIYGHYQLKPNYFSFVQVGFQTGLRVRHIKAWITMTHRNHQQHILR